LSHRHPDTMDALESFLTFFGSALCHQLAERSYSIDSFQMPLCARCLGIHLGFLLATMFILLCRFARHHGCMLQNARHVAALGALMVPAVIDAALSYLGIVDSDNTRRAITGSLFGVALGFLLLPIIRSLMHSMPILGRHMLPATHMIPPVALAIVASALAIASESSTTLFYAVAIMGVAGVFATMLSLVLVLVILVTDRTEWWDERRMEVAGVVAAVLLVVLALAHDIVG
jgi:uncharacterized membrane protein